MASLEPVKEDDWRIYDLPISDEESDRSEDDVESSKDVIQEVTGVRVNKKSYGLMFRVRWTLKDVTWENQHDLLGVKHLVREFYERLSKAETLALGPEEQIPLEFKADDNVDDVVEQATQADGRLAMKHMAKPGLHPQYYDSENEEDPEAIEDAPHQASQVPGQSSQLSTLQNSAYLRNYDQVQGMVIPIAPSLADLRVSGARRFLSMFCKATNTDLPKDHTMEAVLDCLPKLSNALILDEVKQDRASHGVRGLIIAIWLVVCLKIQNNEEPTLENEAHRWLRVLAESAVELAQDPSQKSSRTTLELSLDYWSKRLLRAYGPMRRGTMSLGGRR